MSIYTTTTPPSTSTRRNSNSELFLVCTVIPLRVPTHSLTPQPRANFSRRLLEDFYFMCNRRARSTRARHCAPSTPNKRNCYKGNPKPSERTGKERERLRSIKNHPRDPKFRSWALRFAAHQSTPFLFPTLKTDFIISTLYLISLQTHRKHPLPR